MEEKENVEEEHVKEEEEEDEEEIEKEKIGLGGVDDDGDVGRRNHIEVDSGFCEKRWMILITNSLFLY